MITRLQVTSIHTWYVSSTCCHLPPSPLTRLHCAQWTTRRHLPLCLLLVLLLLLSHSFILTTIGRLIPGAFGPIHPPSSSSPPSTTQGRWSWSYLDPTPVQLTPSSSSSHVQPQPQAHPDFPFTYGVSDRDTRDKAGERFIPAIRYAHATVVSEESLFITHGFDHSPTPSHLLH